MQFIKIRKVIMTYDYSIMKTVISAEPLQKVPNSLYKCTCVKHIPMKEISK